MTSRSLNQVWELVELAEGQKALKNKWIHTIKRGVEGKPIKRKIRSVVKGFIQ